MEKLRMETENLVEENIKKLMEIFPSVVTEVERDGKVKKGVDFAALKQELSDVVVDGNEERYQLTWPDKRKSRLLSNSPIKATLRPCIENSVNFDTTQNVYIEGDNLDVLKLLRETYLGKIKVIYIDPPYNTGNNFIYADKFAESIDEYKGISGDYDEQGNRLVENLESAGQIHTKWLNMMYPRLKVAKDLLADDGVIFVSIDEHEQSNLQKMLDEIFGEKNYISNCFVLDNLKGKSNDNFITSVGSRLFVYAKNKMKISDIGFEDIENEFGEKTEDKYSYEDEIGRYNSITFKKTGQSKTREERPYMYYPILQKDGILFAISQSEYEKIYDKGSKSFNDEFVESLREKYSEYEFILPLDLNGQRLRWTSGYSTFIKLMNSDIFYNNGVMQKKRPDSKDFLQMYASGTPKSLLYKSSYANGTDDFKKLFGDPFFDYPKPVSLLEDILKLLADEEAIVLDFFSGSATTAHAVMQLNAEDGGNRKFIMVQVPEKCSVDSDAFKAGYKTICEIGEERIRKAGKKIKEDSGLMAQNLDIGFRVLKLDSSNMKDVYYKPEEASQQSIEDMLSNVKEDRTPLDLLFQVMLETDALLSSKIEEKLIEGKKVYIVNDDDLICCFDDDIGDDVVKTVAQMKPLYAVFRDSSFKSDDTMVNAEQYFRTYSPDTQYRII